MKNTLFPLCVVFIVAAVCIPVFYFLSPVNELDRVRTENTVLRESLAQVRADNQSELVTVVVVGMLMTTGICLAFLFAVMCLLSGRRPADFFMPSVRSAVQALPEYQERPALVKEESGYEPGRVLTPGYYPVSEYRY